MLIAAGADVNAGQVYCVMLIADMRLRPAGYEAIGQHFNCCYQLLVSVTVCGVLIQAVDPSALRG